MQIIVLDGQTLNPGDNPWTPLRQLGEVLVYPRSSEDQILERAAGAEIVLTNKAPLSATTIERLTNLKFIAVTATGFNQVDLQAARQRGVLVSNVPVYSTSSVAQHVLAMMLSFQIRPEQHDDAIRSGHWQRVEDFSFTLRTIHELAEKTLGLIGFGRIGQATAKVAHAFGMNIAALRRPSSPANHPFVEFHEREELLQQSDYVSLHLPLTQDNKGLVDPDFLRTMKQTAVLINTARGGLVDESALAAALKQGTIAGACLDVVSSEPMHPSNPLLDAPNCLITPHIAWNTLEARHRLMQTTVDNVRAFIAGNPINLVN